MDATFPKNKDLTYDGLVWFFLICFLAMLAMLMLTRDAQKQYGAVTFGVFPTFEARDNLGQLFDQHRLHGQLSAVIVTDQPLAEDISLYLHKLSQATAGGKKYLRSLILTDQTPGSSDQWVQYLTLTPEQFQIINRWKKGLFTDGIILVDQSGVIRGVFNMDDKLERLNFEGAVRGIL